jgi:signal transduction histidine kinase
VRAASDPRARAPRQSTLADSVWPAVETDLQTTFTRALRELRRTTGCERAAAWCRDAAGRPAVLAARIDGAALREPEEVGYAALARLDAPSDLGLATDAALASTTELGFAAAAPVPGDGGAAAVLLIGGLAEPPGRVRPRTLAALGAAARHVAPAASAALTARRLAELDGAVRRLDRLAALGSLVTEIVHEIRNPLVSVKTFLQLLPERVDDPEFREGFLSVASDELRRVERLLDVVLEHGRPAPAPRDGTRTSVAAAMDSVVRLVSFRAAERGVHLTTEPPGDGVVIAAEEDALRQVLLNLLLNAIDATPTGASVALRAREERDAIVLEVDDEGEGVPDELRKRLFEPFFSTKQGRPGGLGLAITKRIVDRAGGTIEVLDSDASPAGGARFRVRLPAPTT